MRTSQPTVSGHIKNLESYIGARLFDRLPRRIAPTRAGQILYEHARVILQEKEAAIQELMKLLGRVEGEVEISASTIGCSVNEFNVVGRLGSTNAVKEAVKAGAGVSVLSLLSVKSDIADGALKTVRIDNLKTIRREFHAVVNRHLTLSPVAEAFLDWIFESRAAKIVSM